MDQCPILVLSVSRGRFMDLSPILVLSILDARFIDVSPLLLLHMSGGSCLDLSTILVLRMLVGFSMFSGEWFFSPDAQLCPISPLGVRCKISSAVLCCWWVTRMTFASHVSSLWPFHNPRLTEVFSSPAMKVHTSSLAVKWIRWKMLGDHH